MPRLRVIAYSECTSGHHGGDQQNVIFPVEHFHGQNAISTDSPVPKTVNGPRVERWRVGPSHSNAPSTDYTVLAMIPPQRDQRSPDLPSATPLARAVPVNGASYGPTTAPVPPIPPRAGPRAPPGASATASETPRRAAAALRSKGPDPLPARHAHARGSVERGTSWGGLRGQCRPVIGQHVFIQVVAPRHPMSD